MDEYRERALAQLRDLRSSRISELLQAELKLEQCAAEVEMLRGVVSKLDHRIADLESGKDSVVQSVPGFSQTHFARMKIIDAVKEYLEMLRKQGREPKAHIQNELLGALVYGGNQALLSTKPVRRFQRLVVAISTSRERDEKEIIYDPDNYTVALPPLK